jgi:hypothetical protein
MDEGNHDVSNPLLTLTGQPSASITPLEQEVLDEYARLLKNMNHVRGHGSPPLRLLKFLYLETRRRGFLFLPAFLSSLLLLPRSPVPFIDTLNHQWPFITTTLSPSLFSQLAKLWPHHFPHLHYPPCRPSSCPPFPEP